MSIIRLINHVIITSMNKTIFIIAISLTALFGGGYLLINSNPLLKGKAERIGILQSPQVPIPKSYNAVFCIFDPSGSGKSTYSVPEITSEYIQTIIARIAKSGSGDFWLTYIDANGNNNKVLHFEIPENTSTLVRPVRNTGERKGDFDKRLNKFREDSIKNGIKKVHEAEEYEVSKSNFLLQCQNMILLAYQPKKLGQDFSDVVGSLNAAIRSLSTISSDSTHFRSILLISDGVQDTPALNPPPALNQIPKDIRIVTVNHSGSTDNVLEGRTIEVDNLDRGLEKIITIYKPIIH